MKYNKSISTCLLGVALAVAVITGTGCGCTPQVQILGSVTDLKDGTVIAGAQVQAVDTAGADVGSPATTDAEGRYTLSVPLSMSTDEGDVPAIYTLRASAEGYETFPTPARPAPALDMALAQEVKVAPADTANMIKADPIFESALTAITLIREVLLRGVVSAITGEGTGVTPLAGAVVQAVDANGNPVGESVVSDETGQYELAVPELWDADGDGIYEPGIYTIVVESDEYQSIASGVLDGATIDMATATPDPDSEGSPLVIDSELTSVPAAPAVVIRGQVLDNCDVPVAGATVEALDADQQPVSLAVLTDAAGLYELSVPQFWVTERGCTIAAPAPAKADCGFVNGVYTLRAEAPGFEGFPSTNNPALPLDMSEAVPVAGEGELPSILLYENQNTALMLIRTIVLEGLVVNYVDEVPIAGAEVWAVDNTGAVVAGPVTTDATGLYSLAVPQAWAPVGSGAHALGSYALRINAEGYWPYPSNLTPSEVFAIVDCQTLGGAVMAMDMVRLVREVLIRGYVLDLADDAPIAGALVQAVDINGTPVGSTAETDANGVYELTAPQIWDLDGVLNEGDAIVYGVYLLRCQAMGYQEFPTAIRPSLPLYMDESIEIPPTGDETIAPLVIDETVTTLTTLKLIWLNIDLSLLGSLSGNILSTRNAGVLIVAVDNATQDAYTGFSGFDGEYVIFNVLGGTYRVEGYTLGVQLVPNPSVTVGVGEQLTGVDLSESPNPLNTVSGSVNIVNAPGGSLTSVVLAVESTFNAAAARGVVPPGLRVGDVTSAFVIDNVPDGLYVVLAAFENDDLVRDPDQTIAGTGIVYIEVPGPGGENSIVIPESFKITEALAVIGPGADEPEAVTTLTPTLEWADDSSENGYEIWVLDSFGNDMWTTEIAGVSGSPTVTLVYGGKPLENAMYYQFKVLSFREKNNVRTAISATEDLKGVFYYQAAR